MIGEQISLDHVLKLPNGTPIWVEELEPRYKFVAKTHRIAYGMKATLSFT